MKLGIKKSMFERATTDWDPILPYVAVGYRMTVQKSLGYSPYYILFGRHPIFPAKIQECENEELPDLEDTEALGLFLDARVHAFQEVMPLAMRNLAIAQHRDKARFRRVRGVREGGGFRSGEETDSGGFGHNN